MKGVTYLGHVVSAEGIHVDPAKTEAVKDWPIPKSSKRDLPDTTAGS